MRSHFNLSELFAPPRGLLARGWLTCGVWTAIMYGHIKQYEVKMKKLEVRFNELTHLNLERATVDYGCTKSDVARAAMILGIKALIENQRSTGLPIEHWIAALNGKVK